MILTRLEDLHGFTIGECLIHKMGYADWYGDDRKREKKTKELRDKVVKEIKKKNLNEWRQNAWLSVKYNSVWTTY